MTYCSALTHNVLTYAFRLIALIIIFSCGQATLSFAQLTDHFVTTWKTDNPGTSNSTSITIPTTGSGYNYDVDWDNDGTFEDLGLTGSATHDYGSAGTYTVRIRGTFPRIYFNNGGDRQKIISIDQWGNIAWTSMEAAFYGCSNLGYTATDTPDLSSVTFMNHMFNGATVFNGDISGWNVSNVIGMNALFQNAAAFNQDIGSWVVNSVYDMESMFQGASSFNQDISSWNTGGVEYMNYMFSGATAFNQNIGGWSLSSVRSDDLTYVFRDATSFNQDISGWNVGSQTSLRGLFYGATAFNQDISGWNVSSVDDFQWMFKDATSFNQDISGWNTSSADDMDYMFQGATTFNQDISGWNTGMVSRMLRMFDGATAFNQDLGDWDVADVTNMSGMLNNTALNVANYDSTLIGWAAQTLQPNVSLGATGLFYCNAGPERQILTNAPNNWTITGDGIDCSSNILPSHFVTTWKTDNPGTSNSTSITLFTTGTGYNYDVDWDNDGYFEDLGLTGSATHDYGNAGTYTIRIRGDFPQLYFGYGGDRLKLISFDQWGNIKWSTNGLQAAFDGCSNMVYNATDAPDLTNVYTLAEMFIGVPTFNGDMSNWTTTGIGNMFNMFGGATGFNLDISSWNTGNVVDMSYMFEGATNFNQNITVWNTGSAMFMQSMFRNATAFNQNLGNWDVTEVSNMYGMLDNTALNLANYDATLTGWAAQNVKPNVSFGADGLTFCAAANDRANLINNDLWSFAGDAPLYCSCPTMTAGLWTGCAGDLQWNNAQNWGNGMLPVSTDNVIINNGDAVTISSGTATVKSITVTNGSSLNIDASATLNVNNSNNDAIFCQGDFDNAGILNISNAGENGLRVDGNFSLTNSGTINITNSDDYGLIVPTNTNTNSGTINIDGTTTYDGFYMSGGPFTNSGTLSIKNTTGQAINNIFGITFDNTGTLTGTGTFNVNGNSLAGTVAPGTSPGTMTFPANQTFTASNTLEIEVNGTTPGTEHDQIVVSGTATISGTLDATINYNYMAGDRIVIISATAISGTFSSINPALPNGWTVDYSVTGEVALVSSVNLPVELIAFNATLTNENKVHLEWATASEIDNKGFELEHSTDGRNWEYFDFIQGAGNSVETIRYATIHNSPVAGINYYRLKQIDFDGNYEYSKAVSVDLNAEENTVGEFYPNPFGSKNVNIKYSSSKEDLLSIFVYDLTGKLVLSFMEPVVEGSNVLTFDFSSLFAGVYMVKLESKKGIISRRIVKQ